MSPLRRHQSIVLLGAIASGALLRSWHVPAGVLLGCMLVGMVAGWRGLALALPRSVQWLAQALVGCLVASSLHLPLLAQGQTHWPLYLAITVSLVGMSVGLGWLLARWRWLPGSTAVWGMAPGAATAMVLVCEDFGADARLVALMQYLRVVVVTALASLVAFAAGGHAGAVPATDPTPGLLSFPEPVAALQTLALAGACAAVCALYATPGGPMLLALGAGLVWQGCAGGAIALPPGVLVLAYATVGLSIGLRFTRDSLRYAWRKMPAVLGAIGVLILAGWAHALVLVEWAGIDPLSAYLATSPGGADSVAVIAAGSPVDMGVVLSMQMARFLLVLLLGPAVSKWLTRR